MSIFKIHWLVALVFIAKTFMVCGVYVFGKYDFILDPQERWSVSANKNVGKQVQTLLPLELSFCGVSGAIILVGIVIFLWFL